MFLFSPKFDWSFSHLPRYNWGCWTLPKCSYFTKFFQILPKTLDQFDLVGPNLMKAAGITTWFHFTQGQCLFCHQRQKIIVWAVLAIILPVIWLLFCLHLENRFYLIECECSCILCPNFENFCPKNGQFFIVGDATASLASPCRTLMPLILPLEFFSIIWRSEVASKDNWIIITSRRMAWWSLNICFCA